MASNWFDQNAPDQSTMSGRPPTVTQVPTSPAQPVSGGDYQQEFMQAVQDLGINPQDFRSNPTVMDKVTTYLNQKYPGQNWTNGGQKAGDWVSVNGQGFDVLPAGDRNWQWLSDPASSTGTSGNPMDPSGFQTGMFTGGGQYPLASVMGTGLAATWTTPFTAPTDLTEQNDPGFQARMKMGTDAIERSAAARGTLLTGGLLKGLTRYAQDYASNEYNNVYNRALGQYQQAYSIFNNNQGNLFNRLSNLGSIGENAAAGVGNAQIGLGQAQGQGSLNQGSIWGNAINTGANSLGQYLYMNALLHQGGGANTGAYTPNMIPGTSTDTNLYE
jgi:hypothetical protein